MPSLVTLPFLQCRPTRGRALFGGSRTPAARASGPAEDGCACARAAPAATAAALPRRMASGLRRRVPASPRSTSVAICLPPRPFLLVVRLIDPDRKRKIMRGYDVSWRAQHDPFRFGATDRRGLFRGVTG